MKNLQENRLGMYLAVRDFLIPNEAITKDLPNFDLYFKELQNTITEIQSIAEVQKSDTKGFAKQKLFLKDKLVTLTLDNSHKMSAFAKFSSNLMLLSEVKMNGSDLKKAPDTGLRDFAQIIYDKAQANLEPLKSYGVTPETQAEFLDTINKYNASLSGPRVAKTETVQATKQLTLLFENANRLVENIDAAIGIIKFSQPNFFNGFKTAKKIINTGTGYLALKGMAIDSASGATIEGARFLFKPEGANLKGNSADFLKTTAEKGTFLIKNMPQGTYSVTVSKPGYREKVVSVVVNGVEMTLLKVEMERK